MVCNFSLLYIWLTFRSYSNWDIINWIIGHDFKNNYRILVKLQMQEKHITLCKIPTHTVVKGNRAADKADK